MKLFRFSLFDMSSPIDKQNLQSWLWILYVICLCFMITKRLWYQYNSCCSHMVGVTNELVKKTTYWYVNCRIAASHYSLLLKGSHGHMIKNSKTCCWPSTAAVGHFQVRWFPSGWAQRDVCCCPRLCSESKHFFYWSLYWNALKQFLVVECLDSYWLTGRIWSTSTG